MTSPHYKIHVSVATQHPDLQAVGQAHDAFAGAVDPADGNTVLTGAIRLGDGDFSALDGDMTKPLIAACFKNGLIIERVGRDNNVLKIMPPLVIEDELLIKGLQIIRDSLKEVL